MKKIVVTGDRVSSKKFEIIFEMLDDGVEAGKIEYIKFDKSTKGALPEADGYIFIIASPWGNKDSYIHILPGDDEDTIIEKVQELGSKMNALTEDEKHFIDAQSFMDAEINQPGVSLASISGIFCTIKGKEVFLSKEDLDCIKALMGMCKDNKFEIKEVIVNE